MADQPDTEVKLPDPVLAAATMAKVAERSQALMKEFLARQSADGKDAPADPLNIGTAFIEMTTRLMRDPAKLVEAQMALWRSYVDIWHQTTLRFLGEQSEPVAEPLPEDRRFKDAAWQESAAFRFHQAIISGDRALDAVDGQPGRRARREDREEGRFLYPPVRRRHGAVELRHDQPRGAARDDRERRREPAEGPGEPASPIWSAARASSTSG